MFVFTLIIFKFWVIRISAWYYFKPKNLVLDKIKVPVNLSNKNPTIKINMVNFYLIVTYIFATFSSFGAVIFITPFEWFFREFIATSHKESLSLLPLSISDSKIFLNSL